MTEKYDIVIRRARTRSFPEKLFDIGIRDGKVVDIKGRVAGKGEFEIDAKGKLVTESFVNAHLHLCKAYTLQMVGEEALKSYRGPSMGEAMTAIELASKVKEKYREDWILENVRRALKLAVAQGVTHMRAFADTDTKAKLEGVKALLGAKEEFKDVLDLQVVAFPQDGVVRDPGAEELVRKAIEIGADIVGGIPWIEYTDEDERKHIDLMFEIAKEHDKDISMLVDDAGDPGLRTLEMLAVKTIEEGRESRSLAHHARAMCLYPEPYFKKVAALLRRAKMGVVSDPHTGPLHARVKDLIREGVVVALGQDDIADAYYPFGRNSMLEVAFLASHLLWMTTFGEMERLYDMITTNAAELLRIESYGLREGAEANLVVLNAESVHEALMYHEPPTHVISHGKLVGKEA
ncbi:MAG: amidohydrolase family protein [Candidatus Hodarchaeaceae archaeon]|nr:amidohydrolase family protein [Candidatus Hodarchaeaceae archaeon]